MLSGWKTKESQKDGLLIFPLWLSITARRRDKTKQKRGWHGCSHDRTGGWYITHVFRINRDVAEFFMWGGPIDQEPKRKERGKRTRRRGCVGDLLKVARLNKEWERARLGRNEGLVFLLRSWCAFFLFLNVSECPQSQTSVLDVDRVWQFGFMTAPSL